MASITRTTLLPGPVAACEELWYDLARRRSFVEGYGHISKQEGDWPRAGARVVWHGPPGGRGLVAEKVDAFEALSGQTVSVEDEQLRGTQTITFTPASGDLVRVRLAFAWTLKEGNLLTDWVFVRRSMGESLRKTLARYRIERIADLDG